MNLIFRLLLVTFTESFATVCVERGVYFYTQSRLGFSDRANLWLALCFGAAYVAGAMRSHVFTRRLGEKVLLIVLVALQLAAHLGLMAYPTATVVFALATALGLLNGMKWPILESYISAGQGSAQTAKTIGRFNISWAAATPLALAMVGPVLAHYPAGVFLVPAALNALAIYWMRILPARPAHLSKDHPLRPPADQLQRMAVLLPASRWLMLFSYAALWVMAALMPSIFAGLGVDVQRAAGLSGTVDLVRTAAFVVLSLTAAWHRRSWPLLASIVVLPAGLVAVLSGANLWVVLGGEVAFGFAAGSVYFAALYYAMAVKNASVDAGGGHEGLIGLGFALGPLASLAGTLLTPMLGSQMLGVLAGLSPVYLLCATAAGVILIRGRRGRTGGV